jgi:hypothetical protein
MHTLSFCYRPTNELLIVRTVFYGSVVYLHPNGIKHITLPQPQFYYIGLGRKSYMLTAEKPSLQQNDHLFVCRWYFCLSRGN